MSKMLNPEDLLLICTNDGVQWWQHRKNTKSHISALFVAPKPQIGDLLIEVDEDDRTIGRHIDACGKIISFGDPFILDVLVDTTSTRIVERNIETGKLMWWK